MSSPSPIESGRLSKPAAADRFRMLATVALVGYWLVMFTGTHWPNLSLAAYPENTDKVLHFTGYSGFGFLLGLRFSLKRKKSETQSRPRPFLSLKDVLGIAAIVVGYSIFDEVSQPPFGRTCDPMDAVADWIGGAIGLGIFSILRLAIWRLAAI
jgi:VanZ family protein